MFSTRVFILTVFCISSAICQKKVCDLADEKCVTNSAKRVFPKWVAGIPGVKSSEPLHSGRVEADLGKLKYTMFDGTLSGVKDCQVDKVKINAKEPKYDLYLTCPLLKIETLIEIKGELGPYIVEGKGNGIGDYYGYSVHIFGDYEPKDNKDGKLHINFKNFNLELDAKEKVVFTLKDVFKADKKADEIDQFVNTNWKQTSDLIAGPAMNAFVKVFIANINDYLTIKPIEEIFTEE